MRSPAAAVANNATPRANPGPQTPTSVSPRVAARNVLKSTLKLVPRTLSHEHQRLWEQRAGSALDELEVGKSRPLRVAGMSFPSSWAYVALKRVWQYGEMSCLAPTKS